MTDDDDLYKITQVIEVATKLKAEMKRMNAWKGTFPCPRCGGNIFATLNGKKQHIWMRCDGGCGMTLME
jgi:predicted RNA-binding Zn-ribbon protein involved in translation (DUF1610 family)